jgi:two-component system invasion response regulator UvrY
VAGIKVLLIDDHPVVRAGYRRLLEQAPDIRVVAEASDGESGYLAYTEYHPDVTILDLSMPGIGGIATIQRLCRRDPKARILVFSIHENDVLVRRALAAGARGYITKRSASRDMIQAVREIARGRSFFSADISDWNAQRNSPLNVLSAREFDVFRLLAEGRTVAEVAELLHISPKTAGVHQTRILRKLKLFNVVQLTRLAIRLGLVDP